MRISFLFFLLMYCWGSFFRASVVDMLFHRSLDSVIPANHRTENRYNEEHSDRRGTLLTHGCIDGKACPRQRDRQPAIKRSQHADDFGDNGPLVRRYADPI